MFIFSSARSFVHSLKAELFGTNEWDTQGGRIYFRIVELFLLSYAVYYCSWWGIYIQQNVTSVLLPLGLANYIDVSFLFDHNVALFNAGLVAVLGVVGFFRVWRPAYFLALIAFHLQYVGRYSLGEINHGSNLIGMGILGLGIALLLFRSESDRRRFLFGYLYFFIGLGYTSAAVCKLIGTGLHWPDGRHLLMWITERKVDTMSMFGAFKPNVLQEMVLQNYHVGTLVLLFGLLVEFFSFLMWWRAYRYVIVALVTAMHVGIEISMDIFFPSATYLLILLMVPWHRLIDWAIEQGHTRRVPAGAPPKEQA